MKKIFLSALPIICLFSQGSFAQEIASPEKYTAHNKGKFYVHWGYNFDWYDAVLQSGMTENNYLNISGRSDSGLSYNLGFGIQSDRGLIENDATVGEA